MARIGTSWSKIQPGDIITFNYKGKTTGKQRLQTILVLNPKWYIVVDGQRVFQMIGLKLAEQRVRTIKEASKVVTQLFDKLGTLEVIDEQKDIYRVRIDSKLQDSVRTILKRNVRNVPVVDSDNKTLLGLVTRANLVDIVYDSIWGELESDNNDNHSGIVEPESTGVETP